MLRLLPRANLELSKTRRLAMKGLVYHGPGQKSWDSVPDPTIEAPTDMVVRIDSSSICGTDLHML
jgi:alcohol dehydrogenase